MSAPWMNSSWDRCDAGVIRDGWDEPCEAPAVGFNVDPEDGELYPTCLRHSGRSLPNTLYRRPEVADLDARGPGRWQLGGDGRMTATKPPTETRYRRHQQHQAAAVVREAEHIIRNPRRDP